MQPKKIYNKKKPTAPRPERRGKKSKNQKIKKVPAKTIKTSAAKPSVKKAITPTVAEKKFPVFFSRSRAVITWSLVLLLLFGVLSALTVYFSGTSSPFQRKLEQASTLTTPSDEDTIVVDATGDIMLARYVELKMRKLKDYTFPFQKVADVLKSADITFGNLETPLMPGKYNTPTGSMTFRADPEGTQGLLSAGYDVISVANNHTMNYQVPGLTSTLVELKKANILAAGGGKNQDAAHTPAIMEVKGKKVAFLAYNDQSIPPGFHGEAKSNFPGIAKMDVEAVKNDIKNAKEAGANIVIVSMHAGREYKREPTQFQKDFAHAAIDAGAAVVIGSHPHWVEGVEKYGKGIIFYSLGNFVFDQSFSEDVKTGLVARITFKGDEDPTAELLPVKIEGTQPRFMEGDEKTAELTRLGLTAM